MVARALNVFALVFLVAFDATAQETLVTAGRVDRFVDGDALDVLLEGDEQTMPVRMQGIDAPEADQLMSDGDGQVHLHSAGQTSIE